MYYFIGIKGAGMSALAVILKKLGNTVSGSDIEKHFFTEEELIKNNIPFYPYNKDNIKEDYIIIKGASIKEDNEELIKAKELKLKIYEYNEMVAELTKKFKTICIAGCHGKTTTTNMFSKAFKNQGISYLIGDGTGDANTNDEYFALESCEYKRHFLLYEPYYAVITNIELDHVDYFKDIDDVIDAYTSYANNAKKCVIAYGDDLYTRKMNLNKKVIYYGLEEGNDVRATNIIYKSNGISFDIKDYGHFDLPLFGKHQLIDVLAVISVAILENIPQEEINNNLKDFVGAKRRFTETIVGNNIIIDDYAHHPTEVRATIDSIKQKYPNKKIVIIFQPHTFTRTKEFYKELINEFSKVDASYILDIHPAREKQEDYPDVTSSIIINELDNCYHININESNKLENYDNTVFAFMSPNDIKTLENDLKEKLIKRTF